MKLLVLADDDSVRHTIQTERADVLVSCGDILDAIILQVAQSIECPRILAVKGNHDSGEPFPHPSLTFTSPPIPLMECASAVS